MSCVRYLLPYRPNLIHWSLSELSWCCLLVITYVYVVTTKFSMFTYQKRLVFYVYVIFLSRSVPFLHCTVIHFVSLTLNILTELLKTQHINTPFCQVTSLVWCQILNEVHGLLRIFTMLWVVLWKTHNPCFAASMSMNWCYPWPLIHYTKTFIMNVYTRPKC